MMEHLLAGQEGAAAQVAANQEEMKACQDKVHAEAKTCQEQLKEDIKGHMEAFLGLRSCEKWMTDHQVSLLACPEKSKADTEEMEANVDAFEEHSSKMEATDFRQIQNQRRP
jgi:hypothetical protein